MMDNYHFLLAFLNQSLHLYPMNAIPKSQTAQNQKIVIFEALPNSKRIKLHIPYAMKEERIAFKQLNSSYYHSTQKLWSIINTPENKQLLIQLFAGKYEVKPQEKISEIPKIKLTEKSQLELDKNYQKLVLKGLSTNTINTYQGNLVQFFSYFENADLQNVTKDQIEGFLFTLVSKYKISEQKQNSMINAIKSYYEHTLGKPREYYNVTRPKKSKDLPNVLSKEEVKAIIN